MSGAHTPGPWGRDRYGSLRGSNGREVNVRGLGIGLLLAQGQEDEAFANARLIAATPELLTEVQELCAILDNYSASDGEGGLCYDHEAIGEEIARRHESLTAAIAKATGGDQ